MTITTITLGAFEDALEHAGCKPRNGKARCPAHEDSSPSLSYSTGTRAELVAHCHAGCTFESILDALQLRPASNGRPVDPRATNPAKPAKSETPEATYRTVATYHYVDSTGKALYDVDRKETHTDRSDSSNAPPTASAAPAR